MGEGENAHNCYFYGDAAFVGTLWHWTVTLPSCRSLWGICPICPLPPPNLSPQHFHTYKVTNTLFRLKLYSKGHNSTQYWSEKIMALKIALYWGEPFIPLHVSSTYLYIYHLSLTCTLAIVLLFSEAPCLSAITFDKLGYVALFLRGYQLSLVPSVRPRHKLLLFIIITISLVCLIIMNHFYP